MYKRQGKNGDRFIRFRSLGEGYTVEDLKAALSGEKRHSSQSRKTQTNRRSLNVPIDIQEKLAAGQGAGYERWANELDPLKILHTTLGHTKNTQGEYLLIGGRVGHDRAIDRIGLVVLRQISTLAASETWPAWQKGSLLLSCLPGQ